MNYVIRCFDCGQITRYDDVNLPDQFICSSCGSVNPSTYTREIRYRHLTDEQRELICNGCGVKGGFIRPPYGEFFKGLCNHHDFNYFIGHTITDKIKADIQLFIAMISKIWLGEVLDDSIFSWFIKSYYSLWAVLYFIAVSIFGIKFFYFGDCEQELPFKINDVVNRFDKTTKGV